MKILLTCLLVVTLCLTAAGEQRLNYSALMTSAKIYLNQMPKDYESAQQRLEQAIRDFPDEPPVEARALLGEIHAEKERYVEMAEEFRIADSICSNATDKKLQRRCKKERIDERIKNVRQSVWIDEYNEGAQYLEEAQDLTEGLADIDDEEERRYLLEDINGSYGMALESFHNLTDISPDSAGGWLNLGITYYRLSKSYEQSDEEDATAARAAKDSSVFYYNKSLDVVGENYDILQNLSTVYFELQDWDKCAATFGRMVALKPDEVTALQNLAMLLMQIRMDDSARVIIDKVLAVDPENLDMRLRRGYMEIEHGRVLNDSINELKKAEGKVDEAEVNRLTQARDDAYQMVVDDFGVVTKLSPEDYDAWYFLGACRYFLEDFEGARDAWEHAAEIKPDNSDVWESLAPLYLKLGDPDKSKEAQKKIEELSGS